MKKTALLLCTLVSTLAIGQTNKPDVIASSGGYGTSTQGSLSWTIGEPVIETVTNGTTILTQGFQQGNLTVTVDNVSLVQNEIDAMVYPNPVNDLLMVKYTNSEKVTIELYDVSGVLLLKQQNIVDGQIINMQAYSTGSYFLKLYNEKQKSKTVKIVKQ